MSMGVTLGTEQIGKRAVDVPAPPRTQAPPPRIRIQLVRARRSRTGAGRSSARSATSSPSRPTSSATATRSCAPSSATAATARRDWSEAPLTPLDAHHNGVRWAGEFPVDARRPGAVDDPGVGRRLRRLARRDRAQARRRPDRHERRDVGGRRAARATRGRATRRGDDRSALEAAAAALESGEPVAAGARRQARGDRRARRAALRGHRDAGAARGLRRPRARPASAPGTSCSRARSAASAACEEQLPRLRSSASTSSTCRRSTRSATRTARAATTRSSPAPTTRAARGRSATRPAATTRSTPTSARSRTSTRSSQAAREHGIDIALDFAINASGDHPWLKEHPEWFNRRPDGTIKYAENPPKKYQDIYNLNWNTRRLASLWDALLKVVRHWVDHGVRVFRVDNPHTKPLPFWEWLIARDPLHRTPT